MNNAEYYIQKTVKPGSTLYYSLLKSVEPAKSCLIYVFAFWQEVQQIVLECQDPGVARVKLMWWKEEVTKYQHQPRHPILKALHELDSELNISTYFSEIIDGFLFQLSHSQFHDEQELDKFIEMTFCPFIQVILQILSCQQDAFTFHLGKGLGKYYLLTSIKRYLNKGYCYIPDDLAEKYQLNISQLSTKTQVENFLTFCQQETSFIIEHFSTAMKHLSPNEIKQLSPILIFTELKLATLNELAKENFPILSQQIKLTPIRKFFISRKIYKKCQKSNLILLDTK